MRRLYFHITLLTVLLAVFSHAHAGSVSPVLTSNNYDAIGEHSQFLIETEKVLSFDQVVEAFKSGQFSKWGKPVLSFGIGVKPLWLKFDIHNQSDKTHLRRLIIETSWLDSAEVYIVKNRQLISRQKTGDTFPFDSRPVDHRFFAFDNEYAPGTSEIYIRVETPDPMVLPIFFGDLTSSSNRDIFNGYSYGMLYGIIIGLLLYNLFIYLTIRQPRYLYYVLYLSMFLLMNLSYTGHGYANFWSGSIWLQRWINPVSIAIFAATGIMFALSFLKIKKLFPQLYFHTIFACAFVCCLLVMFVALNMQTVSVAFSIIFVMSFSVFTVYCAIISFNKGHRDAIYYLVATIATLIGSAITALTVWAIIPYTTLTYRAAEISVSLDAILLSIALAEQIRRANKEKLQAQLLARTDMLTGLNNRRAFIEISTPIWHNAIRHNHELCIILLDIDKFKLINDSYGHGAGDAVLKEISSVLDKTVRDGDVLARWGGEEFAILLPQTSLEQAKLMAERIRQIVADMKIIYESEIIKTTVSLGVSQKNIKTKTIDNVFTAADSCLYFAKQSGRNKVCAS